MVKNFLFTIMLLSDKVEKIINTCLLTFLRAYMLLSEIRFTLNTSENEPDPTNQWVQYLN
jgi:hypothetical protein